MLDKFNLKYFQVQESGSNESLDFSVANFTSNTSKLKQNWELPPFFWKIENYKIYSFQHNEASISFKLAELW